MKRQVHIEGAVYLVAAKLRGNDPEITRGRGELEDDKAFELHISLPASDDDLMYALGEGKNLWHVLIAGFGAIAAPTYYPLFKIRSGRYIPDHGRGFGFGVYVQEKGVGGNIRRIHQPLQDVVAWIGDRKRIGGAASQNRVIGLQWLAD